MPDGWTRSPQGPRALGALSDGDVVLTTGPLAIDPVTQRFVGILVQNNRARLTEVGVRLYNWDVCPKDRVVGTVIPVDPNCAAGVAFDNPGFFYEAQLVLPSLRAIRASVYALTADFQPVADNTLHWRELSEL